MPQGDRYPVTIAPLARTDLTAIGDYIAQDNPQNARDWVAKLETAIQSLSNMPMRFPARGNLRPGLRVVPLGNYLIFFRVKATTVEVVRVIHGARDIDKALDE